MEETPGEKLAARDLAADIAEAWQCIPGTSLDWLIEQLPDLDAPQRARIASQAAEQVVDQTPSAAS